MLEIHDLKLGYDGKAIVSVPKFILPKGEHCLVLGRSGAGKTTLLYALAGLLSPMSGSISINGVQQDTLSAPQQDAFRGQHIGVIYQTLHMVPALSVLENLLLVQYSAGLAQDAQKADALLAHLGIAKYRNKKPEMLSQGQQQRVAIARAAMNSPAIILGDEPTSALDDASCEHVIRLLMQTAQEGGASLIVATHDARLKPYFAKQLMIGEAA